MKQICIKCKKSDKLFTCKGCQQLFCDEHITKHRQELSDQLDNIDKKYRSFEEDLNKNDRIQSYLARIDTWENESTDKTRQTAEKARNDLLEIVNRRRNQLQTSYNKTIHNIQLNRESNDYNEINLNQWMVQLKQLRKLYKTLLNNDIIGNDQSSIQLIKIIDKRSGSLSQEKFEKIPVKIPDKTAEKLANKIILSEDCLTATCTGTRWNGSTISGYTLYSSDVHSIRFQILKKGKADLFFGITSSAKVLNPWNYKIPYAYGWWKIPLTDIKLEDSEDPEKKPEDPEIQTNDEVTLTLDCTNNQIEFEHHRTNRSAYETIPTEQCPFPWRIAIVLYSPGDCVTILS